MASKRLANLDAALRSTKRARTFPVTQDECNPRAPFVIGSWCKSCSHCRSTDTLTKGDAQDDHARPESKFESPVASHAGDPARVEISEPQAQQGHTSGEENAHNKEKSPYCDHKHKDDNIDVPSPAKQNLEDTAGPQAKSPSESSSIVHSKNTSSTDNESGSHESSESVSVSNAPFSPWCTHCGQYWPSKPRPEPFRPEIPYRKGRSLKIYRHEACAPFGYNYDPYIEYDNVIPPRSPLGKDDMENKTLVDLCLEHPPAEGKTDSEESRTLQIVEELCVKTNGGAQLVVCRLDNNDQDYVAKIYDPLYYDSHGFSSDVTYNSDEEYCREVAAYNELDKFIGVDVVPKFHGSWTFQLPLSLPSGQRMRDVRMILIEKIAGKSMLEFDMKTIIESERLMTVARMAQLLEFIAWQGGVRQERTLPRNVMLCDSEVAGELGRIVIVGFTRSVVTLLDNKYFLYGTPKPWPEKPSDPLDRWFSDSRGDNCFYHHFWEWLPGSWDSKFRLLQEWMYERWGKDDRFSPPSRTLVWWDEDEPTQEI